MEYKCSHCRELKPENEYWSRKPNKKWNRSVQSWCKECVRRFKRLEINRKKQSQYQYKWRNENKVKLKIYIDKYKEENLHKIRARDFVHNAIRRYGFQKQPCTECGSIEVQAHHHKGYAREHYLDIIWLCPLHHRDYEGK